MLENKELVCTKARQAPKGHVGTMVIAAGE